MKNLFKTTETLSTEMIEPQLNDYIIPELKKEFKAIIDGIRDHKLNSTEAIFKHKVTYANICNIDTLISERFGIRFKHVAASNKNYGVLPVPPNNYNILYRDISERYSNTKEYLSILGKDDSKYKTVDQIKYNNYDNNDMIFNWYKSINALDKTMNTSSVIIDIKKAKISNLPAEYVVFIQADIYNLIIDTNLDETELTAILLHEVGHGFTAIEYSYRSITNTSVLLDTLRDNLTKKNKSFKDSLILAYEHTYNEKLDKELTSSKIALIHILEKYIDKNNAMNSVPYGNTDTEQLADQFASRFGMFEELSTALKKVYINYDNSYFYNTLVMTSLLYVFPLVYFTIIVIILTGLISAGLAFIGGYTLLVSMIYLIQSISTDGNMTTGSTYDDSTRRIIRIKNDIVRQLRLNGKNLDKDTISNLLANITNVENILKDLPKIDDTTFIDRFIRNHTTAGKHSVKLKLTEQLIEDLMENDLHVATYKIKDIK